MLKKPFNNALIAFMLMASTGLFAKNPGEGVDDFTLKGVDGKEYNLSNTLKSSNYVVVIFISTECPFVQPYTERINTLANEYGKKGSPSSGLMQTAPRALMRLRSMLMRRDIRLQYLKMKTTP